MDLPMEKPVHTLVLDSGSIIKNEPPVSTLINQAEKLLTVPAILSELKDAATRSRVETTLRPFLTLRSPNSESIKFVTDFARRTGDLNVLSKPDIHIIALAYEVECERNHGDWRLRRIPGQKRVNGAPPANLTRGSISEPGVETESQVPSDKTRVEVSPRSDDLEQIDGMAVDPSSTEVTHAECQDDTLESETNRLNLDDEMIEKRFTTTIPLDVQSTDVPNQETSDSEPDADGWITPSNLNKVRARDTNGSTTQTLEPKVMQVAVLTTDFAMQNVILQINLNLLSPSMTRVKHIKTYVLRCHACFQVSKDMTKQFCSRCGQPTLTRVSCSTNANGEFKLHLKKNMQWNHRGDRYSVPKPVHGSAHGRVKGGGKGGWGNDPILTEDQKEYENAAREERRRKERNLMDEDYLPSILTGERGKTGGRIRIGAGKSVNSRKR